MIPITGIYEVQTVFGDAASMQLVNDPDVNFIFSSRDTSTLQPGDRLQVEVRPVTIAHE